MDCTDLRSTAVEILKILPKTAKEEWFDSIMCQGRMSDQKYFPVPDLCHWLLWKLGCRDSKILCRNVPECDIKYTNFATKKILLGARRLSAWRSFTFENSPLPGDILHLGTDAQGEQEHICVFLRKDGRLWTTAGVTMSQRTGLWTAQETTCEFDGLRLSNETSAKQLNGWIDICSIMYEAPPELS